MEGEYPPSRKIKSEFIDKTETLKERKIIERIENELEFEKSLIPYMLGKEVYGGYYSRNWCNTMTFRKITFRNLPKPIGKVV
jgi:hypothetical protein